MSCNHEKCTDPCADIRVVAAARQGELQVGDQVLVEGEDLKPGDEIMVRGQRATVNDFGYGGPTPDNGNTYGSPPGAAALETAKALGALDRKIIDRASHLLKPATKPAGVLTIAEGLIHGERAATHGPVNETFSKIGVIFDNMLTKRERTQIAVSGTPSTAVAKMLIALKLARESYNPDHRDNLIDAAGYIGLLDELK